MSNADTNFGKSGAMRSISAVLALAVLSSSTSIAFAQAKAGDKKPAAAKPAATAKPATTADKKAAAAPAKTKAKPGDKKAAGAAFKKGKEAFDKKEWAVAKESFMEADEILPAATAQYYIARSQEELGEHAEAVKMYEKATADGKLKEELATDAKSRMDALKKKPAKVKVTSDPAGATILVDGKAVPEKTPAEIELAPGTHKITLQAAGKKDNEQSVEVAAFTGATLNASLEDKPAAPAEDPFAKKDTPPATTPATTTTTTTTTTATVAPDAGKKDMTWVYVTGGAAIVALGVGTFFGIQAMSNKSKFDDAVAAGSAADAREHRDDGTRNALISDMGFGIGITLAVTSAVLYFTRPAAEEKSAAIKPATKLSVAPVVTPNAGFLSATVNF
jgi:serine/threonine-protein kinase